MQNLRSRSVFSESIRQELLHKAPLASPLYVHNTSTATPFFKGLQLALFSISCLSIVYDISVALLNRVYRKTWPNIPKKVTWLICFPTTLYYLLRTIIGYCVHSAALPRCVSLCSHIDIDELRAKLAENLPNISDGERRVVQRFSVRVDGNLIDALLVGKQKNINNGYYMICSNGSAGPFELKQELKNKELCVAGVVVRIADSELCIADELGCTCIVYNYPNVGRSEGSFLPSSLDVIGAHQAVYNCACKVFNAKCIVAWGCSLGGGVQGESLKTMKMPGDVKHVFIKYMSFSAIEKFVVIRAKQLMSGKIADCLAEGVADCLGKLCVLLGWGYSSVESSKMLPPHTEIIIQTGSDSVMSSKDGSKLLSVKRMESSDELADTDGVIPRQATYAYAMRDEDKTQKTFLLVPNQHCDRLSDETIQGLAKEIRTLISRS